MRKIERYLLIAVGIKAVVVIIAPLTSRMLLPSYIAPGNQTTILLVSFLTSLLPYIGNIGFGLWLYKESRSYLWGFLGIFFSIPAVILYYAVRIVEDTQSKSHPQNLSN